MKILIVEDDGGSRAILEEHLQARGWHALCAATVDEARRMVRAESFDLILTDIHLPGAEGTEHIRGFCQGSCPVVVMTGFPTLETCLDSIQHGAAAYLVKPFRVAEFVGIAERAMQRRGEAARVIVLENRVRELEQELARLRAPLDASAAPDAQAGA